MRTFPFSTPPHCLVSCYRVCKSEVPPIFPFRDGLGCFISNPGPKRMQVSFLFFLSPPSLLELKSSPRIFPFWLRLFNFPVLNGLLGVPGEDTKFSRSSLFGEIGFFPVLRTLSPILRQVRHADWLFTPSGPLSFYLPGRGCGRLIIFSFRRKRRPPSTATDFPFRQGTLRAARFLPLDAFVS